MFKTLRITQLVCVMLALVFAVGCSEDTPTVPDDGNNDPPIVTGPAGTIGIYRDVEGKDANIIDTGERVTLYVVHKVQDGALASSFRVIAPTGWTHLSTAPQFPVSIGNVMWEGVSIGYGTCQTGAVHIMTLDFIAPGNSDPDAKFEIVPHSRLTGIEVVDCDEGLLDSGEGIESPVTLP